MDISIVIVNWNTKDFLRRCLLSLREQQGATLETYVVDNNSSDGSKEMLLGEFPEVHAVRNTMNRGFARANNQVLSFCKGDVVILMNPDIELTTPHDLKDIHKKIASHNCGILGPRLRNPDGTVQQSVRSFPTFTSLALIMLKLHLILFWLPVLKKYFQNDVA